MNSGKKSGAETLGTIIGLSICAVFLILMVKSCAMESSSPKVDYGVVCGWCNGAGRYATGHGYETKVCPHCGGSGRAN